MHQLVEVEEREPVTEQDYLETPFARKLCGVDPDGVPEAEDDGDDECIFTSAYGGWARDLWRIMGYVDVALDEGEPETAEEYRKCLVKFWKELTDEQRCIANFHTEFGRVEWLDTGEDGELIVDLKDWR